MKDRALIAFVAIICLAAGFVAGHAVGRRQSPRISPTDRLAQKILGDGNRHQSLDAKRPAEFDALRKKLDKELRKHSDDHGHGK